MKTKTILDIANEANVSKMKVRRYIQKWNIVPEQTGSVFRFSDSVARQIILELSNNKVEHVPDQIVPKSEQNVMDSKRDDTVFSIIELLKKELVSKENQLIKKDNQIDALYERLAHEQKLNEQNQILLKHEQEKSTLLLETFSEKKTFFQKIFKKL